MAQYDLNLLIRLAHRSQRRPLPRCCMFVNSIQDTWAISCVCKEHAQGKVHALEINNTLYISDTTWLGVPTTSNKRSALAQHHVFRVHVFRLPELNRRSCGPACDRFERHPETKTSLGFAFVTSGALKLYSHPQLSISVRIGLSQDLASTSKFSVNV